MIDVLDELKKLSREDSEPSAHTRDVVERAIAEIERLREIEFMYESCSK